MPSHASHAFALPELEWQAYELLRALPAAIYTTDAAGRITFYNEAAVELWGHEPELGKSEFCGSWKLYWPDGTPLPHDECPMAIALREKRPNRGMEAIAERPDGSRVPFIPYPTPLFDAAGHLIGAINMLIDITDRKRAEQQVRESEARLLQGAQDEIEERRQAQLAAQRLASIIESSDDAILAKDLDGIITDWNRGAERLFGYKPEEVIGRPVTILIPADRQDEEPNILARLRRGERIDHYETIRRRKDGSLVEISLTVSPIRGPDGRVVGASKIARDITERRRAQERQQLLLREMDHRIKNLFTLSGSLVSLSARSAATPQELASTVGARLSALARAHDLTLSRVPDGDGSTERSTTLHALIETIVSPYDHPSNAEHRRVTVSGPDTALTGGAVTSFALLLHEFATNAAKYGALSTDGGRVDVACFENEAQFVLTWTERGGPAVGSETAPEGFGSLLARMTVKGQLGGEIVREWRPEGLVMRLSVARDRLTS